MRYWSLLLLAVTPLSAQFSQFAATDDGSQVYFTSQLVLYSGSTLQNTESRLYRIGADGVTLAPLAPVSLSVACLGSISSSFGISGTQISGDGSLIGYTLQLPCGPNPEAELSGSQTADLGPGTLQLSRNGRWVLLTTVATSTPPAPAFTYTLIDLTNGQRTTVTPAPYFSSRAIASDGSVLVQGGIWKQGQVTPIPFPLGLAYNPLALSDDASTIVSYAYVTGPAGATSGRLVATAVATGKPTVLYQQTSTTLPFYMGMSNDGRHALYRVTPLASAGGTVYVADTSTGESTAIPLPDGELAVDGTISGAGDIVFLETTLGRIVKVTLATGAVEPLIPPTPYVSNLNGLPIGSLVRLQTTYPGTAADWTGEILVGGQPLPVIAVKPGEVDVQVPWEQPSGEAQFHVALQDGSPFEQFQQVFVSPIAPAFEPLDPGETAIFPVKIVRGDWSGLQTTQPKAGDIVYLYLTGLGPVATPVATGEPASLTTPDPILGSLTCTFSPETTPAETLFAGLAPGLVGVYQVAFRMPSDPNTQPLNGIFCNLNGQASFGFGIIVGIVSP
jgi:uncharacterized protein (TIGR03437 family)